MKKFIMKQIIDEEEIEEDEDIYTEEGREQLLDDAELSTIEEAFMKGYAEAA